MFAFSGRDEAPKQAAKCLKAIARPITETTRIDRKVPVFSGLSGLGKTRMLEDGIARSRNALLQDLLGVLGDIMESLVEGVRIYPMFAGTQFVHNGNFSYADVLADSIRR